MTLVTSSVAEIPTGASAQLMPTRGLTRAGRYLSFLDSVDRHLDCSAYDVVHAMLPVRRCTVYHPHAGLALDAVRSGHLIKAGRIRQLISATFNQFNRRRRLYAGVELKLLSAPHPPVVLCLSERIKSTIKKLYPSFSGEKLVTLFNSTDLVRFDPSAVPDPRSETRSQFGFADDDIVGLMIAQDFERKGLRQAIEAVAKNIDKRLKLLVAGKQDAKKYRNLAEQLGVRDQVRFAGPTKIPVTLYRAADFFVLPTRADPCSLVVLEALAMGVPVITTGINGASEVMSDGVHGRVLDDPSDVNLLSDAMTGLLNADKRKEASDACLSLRQKLSSDQHYAFLQKIYAAVLRN